MTRVLTFLLVGFLVAAAFVMPGPRAVGPDTDVGLNPPAFSVCLVEEGGGLTSEITAVSMDEGEVQLTLYANGGTVGSLGTPVGALDPTVIPVGDITALGAVVGLLELPSANGAVSVLTRGVESLAAEACISATPAQTFLTGGDTLAGNEFDIHLLNPFAVDAVVRLVVTSDVGVEANPRFASVTILARSSVALEMRQLIPNRERISVSVESLQGRVVSVGRQAGRGHAAIWSAQEPASDWFVPLFEGAGTEVLIGNPSGSEIDFQVDMYGPDGLRPAELIGVVPPHGQITLDLESGTGGIRVIASAPVTTTLRTSTEDSLALTSGVGAPALRWLVPGALNEVAEEEATDEGEEPVVPSQGRLVVLNPDIADAAIVIRTLGAGGTAREFVVPAEGSLDVSFGYGDAHLIEADIAVVVLWVAGPANAFSMGVALPDG